MFLREEEEEGKHQHLTPLRHSTDPRRPRAAQVTNLPRSPSRLSAPRWWSVQCGDGEDGFFGQEEWIVFNIQELHFRRLDVPLKIH